MAQKITAEEQSLKVTGYLSSALSVNLPMHIPGVGNFLISHVETEDGEVILRANAERQPSLNPEAEVDMLDAEQTFPTEEEIEMEQNKAAVRKRETSHFHSRSFSFAS